jgi:hypothetical protein
MNSPVPNGCKIVNSKYIFDFWKKIQNWWLLAKSNTHPNNETNSSLILIFERKIKIDGY